MDLLSGVRTKYTRRTAAFFFLVMIAPAIYFFIGMPPPNIAKDAGQYNAFAVSLVEGRGYTLDGTTFSNFREPGYPLFIALIYGVFGTNNTLAVLIAQMILLGLLGFIVSRIFIALGEEWLGYIAGLSVALLPSYGHYAYSFWSELVFTFLLGLIFSITFKIVKGAGRAGWRWYALLGLFMGYATLVRLQLLFFLAFLTMCSLFFAQFRSKESLKKTGLALAVFLVTISSWIFYVYEHTGAFSITTKERAQTALYLRATRADLSYGGITQYAISWVKRSVTGGVNDEWIKKYDYKGLYKVYFGSIASTTESAAVTYEWSKRTILENPGHYLYGNVIEAMKLLYVEHDYSDYFNRYLRAGMYLVIYSMFLFGLVQLLRVQQGRDCKILSFLALLFIVYNILVITPFDAIPRYNVPYLFLFMIVGFAGIALFIRRRRFGTQTKA